MDNANRHATFNGEQSRDLSGVEQFERLADQLVRTDCCWASGHDLVNTGIEQIVTHMASEVAVGDYSDQRAIVACDTDASKTLSRHVDDGIGHFRAGRH